MEDRTGFAALWLAELQEKKNVKWIALALSTGLTATLTITAAYGQGTVIYPAKGQTPEGPGYTVK